MRTSSLVASLFVSFGMGLVLVPNTGCSKKDADQSSYFDRTISPILTTSCVNTNTNARCHVQDPKGNALGNLDLSTYDGVNHRRDLLADYGPYGQPALLIKNVPPFQVQVQTFDGQKIDITTDIKHTGGAILDPTASAYQVLRRWIQNGATENNTGAPPANLARQACTTIVPQGVAGFDPNNDPTNPNFAEFRDKVNGVLGGTCAAANCHGNTTNDLYLTCGQAPDQLRWNYYIASQYISQVPEDSEIVRRPLAPAEGGSFHEGGIIFSSVEDSNYQALLTWAKDQGAPDFSNLDPNFAFFAHKVQPMLVKKGCMMLQCHSSAQFHDYRLRGGSGGSFSYAATQHNYQLSLAQLSLESDDVNQSRMVQKNLFRPVIGATGLTHRGGPLLEDFANPTSGQPGGGDGGTTPTGDAGGASPEGGTSGGGGGTGLGSGGGGNIGTIDRGAICDAAGYDYDNGNIDQIPAYCIIREWHKRERAARNLAPFSGIVYVKRSIPTGSDRPTDFDVYAGGADLHIAAATMNATGDITVGADKSVTAGCGLDPATADIRRPAVSWDGKLVAFAARASASDPLEIYQMNVDGSACAKLDAIDSYTPPQNAGNLLVHNFDPVYSPQGADGQMRIVFASTRGNTNNPGAYDYSGPQRMPSDPTKPNSDLFVLEPDPSNAGQMRVRQLTYQLDMEREPSFMSDGRIIFTSEKREQDFYELALRRMDLDGSDYHPLYSQRGSIGYYEATNVIELADKNFMTVFSNPGVPHNGGTLGVFNRSIGVDYTSTNPADYPIDPTVTDPNSATSVEADFFLHSLFFPDSSVSGVPGQPTTGVYCSPSMLPEGKALVSFGAASDPGTFGGDYDIYEIDPVTGQKSAVLIGGAGTAEVDAVGIFARNSRGIFNSTLDEPNSYNNLLGAGHSEADILVLDMPVLATLLFQNTPTGRPIEPLTSFQVYEDLPPPLSMTDFGAGGPNVVKDAFGQVFVSRRLLGQVPIDPDGSAHFQVPGGLPFSIQLPDTQMSQQNKWPRLQREQMAFEPGEYAHQSFRRDFFNGLCANCHGAISGHQVDVAVQPDILSQASTVQARGEAPTNLNLPPGQRGAPVGP